MTTKLLRRRLGERSHSISLAPVVSISTLFFSTIRGLFCLPILLGISVCAIPTSLPAQNAVAHESPGSGSAVITGQPSSNIGCQDGWHVETRTVSIPTNPPVNEQTEICSPNWDETPPKRARIMDKSYWKWFAISAAATGADMAYTKYELGHSTAVHEANPFVRGAAFYPLELGVFGFEAWSARWLKAHDDRHWRIPFYAEIGAHGVAFGLSVKLTH